MIRQNSALSEALKTACLENISEVFDCYGRNYCLPIVFDLVPDWTTRLATWAKTEIIQHKAQALSYGGKVSYYSVESVFKNLKTNNLLENVLTEIANQDPDGNLKKELERIVENITKAESKNT